MYLHASVYIYLYVLCLLLRIIMIVVQMNKNLLLCVLVVCSLSCVRVGVCMFLLMKIDGWQSMKLQSDIWHSLSTFGVDLYNSHFVLTCARAYI